MTSSGGRGAAAGVACAGRPAPGQDRRARRRRAGIGALDALIGGGLALVALALTVKLGGSAYDSYRVTNAVSNLNTLTQKVRTLYGHQAGYAGLTNTVLLNARQVPLQMMDGTGTTIVSPWNTAVTVAGTAASFTVTVAAVPQGACAELAVSVGGGVGLVAVVVNQTALSLPPDVTSTTMACDNSTNAIMWTFTN